jgi:membrane-associated protease RseP (regulator of RpoE activity)
MENPVTSNNYRTFIERIFVIDDVTEGSQNVGYLTRYRGHLRAIDSIQAYTQLAEQLKPFNITPLFRKDGDRQAILLKEGVITPKESNSSVNLILFILTVLSVLFTGAFNSLTEPLPTNILQAASILISKGWPFAVSMMAILSAHEFGHYFMGRHYGIHVTLPYFIPLPLSPFGTMGAVINMKEPTRNKRELMDIGIAGPLAGLAVAIPVLFIGLRLSTVGAIHAVSDTGQTLMMEGNSLLYLFMKFITFGQLLPQPASFNGMNPILYWIGYFFTAHPFPIGGRDVMIDSVAWAGWAGLLITSLNLIPAGQLDGGHMIYTLLGKEKAKRIRPIILVLLVLMGFVWNGWWLWAVIVFFFGRYYAEPLDQITELDSKRKLLAVFGLIIFILVFTPVPLILIG